MDEGTKRKKPRIVLLLVKGRRLIDLVAIGLRFHCRAYNDFMKNTINMERAEIDAQLIIAGLKSGSKPQVDPAAETIISGPPPEWLTHFKDNVSAS